MSHWSDAGFGTDPEGDARRRAELEHARLDRLPAIPLGAALPNGATLDDLRAGRTEPEPVEGELLPVEGAHAIERTEYPWGVAWVCACGRWEAVATGPSSASWAGADHARHVRDEEAGARGE